MIELIIVITILAILATIAFISFKSYSGNARDGNRVITLNNLQKGLDIYQVKVGNYPHPDDVYGTGMFQTESLNYVGYIKDNISRIINMNTTPVDPKTQNNYVYGVSVNYQKYQIATILEELEAGIVIPTTYAAQVRAKVVGNYIYPLKLGNKIYSLPSLIFTGSGDLITNSTFTGFIVNNNGNLPYSLDGQLSNNMNVAEQLQQITGKENLTLTGVDIGAYTSPESLTGTEAEQIAASLGISVKDLGNVLFNNSNNTNNNSTPPTSGGEVETPEPEETPEHFFTFDSETQTITGYDINGGNDVVIPSKIGGVDVLHILDEAFYEKQLTSVSIPKGVITIGVVAFYGNQLTSITIPESVTSIGDHAFYGNQLTSILLPNSITTIGTRAFNDNKLPDNQAFIYKRNSDGSIDNTTLIGYGGANKTPTIPNNVTTIGDYAFIGSQLTSVTIPDSVTNIGQVAFNNNKLTSVTIPNSVTTIGFSAFEFNLLTSITIPNSVTTIGSAAFLNNSLTSITFERNANTTIGGSVFGGHGDGLSNITQNVYGVWNKVSDTWTKQ